MDAMIGVPHTVLLQSKSPLQPMQPGRLQGWMVKLVAGGMGKPLLLISVPVKEMVVLKP